MRAQSPTYSCHGSISQRFILSPHVVLDYYEFLLVNDLLQNKSPFIRVKILHQRPFKTQTTKCLCNIICDTVLVQVNLQDELHSIHTIVSHSRLSSLPQKLYVHGCCVTIITCCMVHWHPAWWMLALVLSPVQTGPLISLEQQGKAVFWPASWIVCCDPILRFGPALPAVALTFCYL